MVPHGSGAVDILNTIVRRVLPPLLLVASSLITGAACAEDSGPTRVHQMKAACIHKFARYIHWPDAVNRAASNPGSSICLLGEDPYDGALQALQRTTDISVRQVDDVSQTTGCHMLVIGASEQARLDQVLQALRGQSQSVVTISEIDGFTNRGGMIHLFSRNNRIVFDISQSAARAAQLRFDLRLIHLANVVRQ